MRRELRGAMAALFVCRDREVLVEGRAGTAKTTGILTKLIYDCETYPGCRVLVCRQTRHSLSESVMVTFDKLVKPGHPAYRDAGRTHRNANTWPNGSTIVWGGLNEPEGLFSTEWDRVYVAEATEVEFNDWELFTRGMRNGKTPYHQRIADCNPGAPGHWLNKRSTPASDLLRDATRTREEYNGVLQVFNHHQKLTPEHPMRRLISVHQDNPGYWDFATWDWTPEGREYITGMEAMTGHNRERMLSGRWRLAEGSVYPEFDPTKHVCRPFPIPPEWPMWVGWDPGYDHPTAILWVARAPNGCLYVIDEIYQGGMSVAEHCAGVHKRNAGRTVRGYYADPQYAFSSTAGSPVTIAEQAGKCGIRMSPWPRTGGAEEAMVNAVREKLKHVGRNGRPEPMLKVFETCPATIAEFQSWRYARNAKGERPGGVDKFEDRNNDCMDVIKGLVAAGLGEATAGGVKVYGGEARPM